MAPLYWRDEPLDKDLTKEWRDHDNFMMDFENWVLSKWDSRQGVPKGLRRYENDAWASLMKENLEDSDTTWSIYVSWVENGGGDEWFQPLYINDGENCEMDEFV